MDLKNKSIAELKAIQEKGREAMYEIINREKDFAWCLRNIKSYKVETTDRFVNFIFEVEGEEKTFYCSIEDFNFMPFWGNMIKCEKGIKNDNKSIGCGFFILMACVLFVSGVKIYLEVIGWKGLWLLIGLTMGEIVSKLIIE